MPYDNDGTVVVTSAQNQPYTSGATTYPNGAQLLAANGSATLTQSNYAPFNTGDNAAFAVWFFFPEQREVTGASIISLDAASPVGFTVQGSNDTTNGLDGTWETASLTGTLVSYGPPPVDAWRSAIATISFTGAKRVLRIWTNNHGSFNLLISLIHVYGQKAAGQTPDDILFLDGNNAYAEFTAPADFGDRPLGTTQTWPFKVKNGSATKTANTINLQLNDADFSLSSDGVTWVTTLNIASLAAGASSGVMYVRNTTPSPGAALGPRFARVVGTVGSWT